MSAAGEEFFRSILDNIYDGVYVVDRQRRIAYWSRGAERISGYRDDEVVGVLCHDDLFPSVHDADRLYPVNCPLIEAINDGRKREVEMYLKHRNGSKISVNLRVSPIWDSTGTHVIGAVETFSDTSSHLAIMQLATALNNIAYVDSLTETGNRRLTDARLREDLVKHQTLSLQIGILFMDIDSFKDVNDCYGHDAGDKILQMTAGTLTSNLRSCDFVGRWGGDEFLVILANAGPEETQMTATRLRALISESRTQVNNEMLGVTVSIGATTVKLDDTPKSVMKRADELLYCSKREGRNRVTCYFPEHAESES